MTPEEKEFVLRHAKAVLAQQENLEGFSAFYELVMGSPMLPHQKLWAEKFYEAKRKKKGLSLMAFRGSRKTTFCEVMIAFMMGKHPTEASMIIQVSDDKADKFTKNVADIIENNSGWKLVYPNIVPNKKKGWSSTGYEIMDSSMTVEKWSDANAKRITPSLVGCGWGSGLIVGFHPSLILLLDDILDKKTVDSTADIENVRGTIKASINPSATKGCMRMLAFTPWKDGDPVIEQSESGNYEQVKTPVFTEDMDSPHDWHGTKVKLTWGDEFDIEVLESKLNETGTIEFARMYLLDLTKAKDRKFIYHYFPSKDISPEWIMAGGVDYAASDSNIIGSRDTDYFAMCYIAVNPAGGVVITGGVWNKGTQLSAEQSVISAQEMFKYWNGVKIEIDGKGYDFVQMLMRNPNLKVVPGKTGGKSKAHRFLTEMSPWLESGQVRISDEETPFLNELRKELDEYNPQDYRGHDDALDALYYALQMVPYALKQTTSVRLPNKDFNFRRPNPMAALGRR